ncbi:UNVERIFIED_CONTAM: Phosphatidylinositol/phosphatidylcholine transfer protein SFH9 [Sesamum latifolium]|uniref:Phosphatidylinositol/phosphatidylcholine transfer protein SFH9 n=1 Tax=Sesamum latifolium TaxID=2727402 RepID=A0AAW2Y458_9LAMI
MSAAVTDVILRLLTYICFILGGLIRKFLKMENMETVPENHGRTQVATSNSQEKTPARPNTKELLDPCYQKLQHLENSVTELLKKPAKIPPEKEEIIFESLNRIKSIEYDLQKTKKALLATTSRQEELSESLEILKEINVKVRATVVNYLRGEPIVLKFLFFSSISLLYLLLPMTGDQELLAPK